MMAQRNVGSLHNNCFLSANERVKRLFCSLVGYIVFASVLFRYSIGISLKRIRQDARNRYCLMSI